MKRQILMKLKELEKNFSFNYNYKVNFNLNSKNLLGGYSIEKDIIYFNLNVAINSGFDKFKEVVIHEFSHMIENYQSKINLNDIHGEKWKKIMIQNGAKKISETIDLSLYI